MEEIKLDDVSYPADLATFRENNEDKWLYLNDISHCVWCINPSLNHAKEE